MDITTSAIMISLSIITHYKVLELCFIVLVGINLMTETESSLKNTLLGTVIPFSLAVIIVFGLIPGVIKGVYPEADRPDEQIVKEAFQWTQN